MSEKVVRDPIHGNIRVDGVYVELLDTGCMQRLRNIKQNGLCYLVYPAMNSTRFEHSLGVHHMADKLSQHLDLGEGEALVFKAACLLHDVGHGPFSHTFDVMGAYGFDHEVESVRIIQESEAADLLKSAGIKPKSVAELIRGRGKLGKLLSSEVDVDKMDYLVRDAYYAGVAYGVTDVERLLYSLRLEGGDVVVDIGGLEAAESLLISRNMMYQTVYRHHTKRIAESMFTHALVRLVEDGAEVSELSGLDDLELVHLMRCAKGYVKDMMSRLDERRLFKRVFSERIMNLTDECKQELSEGASGLEGRMAADLGVDEGYVLLDYPEERLSEFKVKVDSGEGLKSISEVSPLAKALEASEREKLQVSLYAREGDRDRFVGFKPERYLKYTQTRLSGYV
jgi:HD superfamily phosphohydrolase